MRLGEEPDERLLGLALVADDLHGGEVACRATDLVPDDPVDAVTHRIDGEVEVVLPHLGTAEGEPPPRAPGSALGHLAPGVPARLGPGLAGAVLEHPVLLPVGPGPSGEHRVTERHDPPDELPPRSCTPTTASPSSMVSVVAPTRSARSTSLSQAYNPALVLEGDLDGLDAPRLHQVEDP